MCACGNEVRQHRLCKHIDLILHNTSIMVTLTLCALEGSVLKLINNTGLVITMVTK